MLEGSGIQVSGIGHPFQSVPPGQDIMPEPQSTGQEVIGQCGSMSMHHIGIGHPIASVSPPHIIWSDPHITGQTIGQISVLEGMGIHVSAIGHPS